MTEQKIIITNDQDTINEMIDKGWVVKSVTSQHVSTNGGSFSSTEIGKFCFVMEKSS